MYKLVILSAIVAMASAGIIAPAGLGYAQAPLGYAQAPLGYAAAPVAYAQAPLAYAPAPVVAAPVVAKQYALPPVKEIQETPIVEQLIEPVEQWGYKVAY